MGGLPFHTTINIFQNARFFYLAALEKVTPDQNLQMEWSIVREL